MKKIFTLVLGFSSFAFVSNAQTLLTEDFEFTGNLTDNGWVSHSGGGNTAIGTTNGLTYAGYAGSGVGNAANMTGAGEDDHKDFALQSSGSLFITTLVNVNDVGAFGGMYFMHLGAATGATFGNFTSRIYVKTDASTGVNFGASIAAGDANGIYGASTFLKNTTYLLIVKYMINSTGNDSMALWVKDAGGAPATEAELGTPEVTTGGAQPGADGIDGIALRQNVSLPDMVVDGIRVGKTYSAVLPLSLVSFKASLVDNTVLLNWLTSTDMDVKEFSIERSNDGRSFAPIGLMYADNTAAGKFSYTDKQPLSGANFYRLKITGKDGAVKYSNTLSVNRNANIKASLFPNPAVNNLTVKHSVATSDASIKIINGMGQQIKLIPVQKGATQTSVAVDKLTRGNYIVVYQNDGEKTTTQFMKQ